MTNKAVLEKNTCGTAYTKVCYSEVAAQLPKMNFPALSGQQDSAGQSDNVDHHFLSPTTINPLTAHHFTSCHIDL